jgi:single-strand DNA-binding protein
MIKLIINKATLTADAEIKDVNGTTLVTFSVAHNEHWKDKQGEKQSKVTFFKCQKWNGSQAMASALKKGTVLYLEGTPQAEAYTNKDGELVTSIVCNVSYFEFISSPKKDEISKIIEKSTQPEIDDDLPY